MDAATTKTIVDIAMQTGVIVGLTSLVAKITPEHLQKIVLPFAAMFIGVAAVVLPLYVDIGAVFQGIILGGSVTGLYGAAKDLKQTRG